MRKRWSNKEIELCKKLISNGLDLDDIGLNLGRSKKSIICKFNKLGIKISDFREYYEEKECLECEVLFKSLKSDNQKFCSQPCSASYNNKRRTISEKTKKKISEGVKSYINENGLYEILKNKNGWYKECPICLKRFYVTNSIKNKIYCSRDCYHNDVESEFCDRSGGGYRKNSTRKNRSKYKGYWMDSGSEREFAVLMEEHNIKWIKNSVKFFEYKDKNGKLRKYYPDFYFPEYDFWVEIKGRYYETEFLKDKLRSVGNIELIYHDEIKIPEFIKNKK